MKGRIVERAARASMPWKNGGGTTEEIARHDDGTRWLWRVSVAHVARSGPFSDFRGYDRIIALLQGAGMELRVDGAAHRLERHRPFAFDGGAVTEGRLLEGPVMDLNLMVDRDRAKGRMSIGAASRGARVDMDSDWMLLLALDGEACVACGGAQFRLLEGDAWCVDAARGASYAVTRGTPGALLADMRIDRRP